jgi:hypothetical protein
MRALESHISKPQSSPLHRARIAGGLLEWFVVLCVLGALSALSSCSGGGRHGDDAPDAGAGSEAKSALSTSNGRDIPFSRCPKESPSSMHSTTDAAPATLTGTLVPIKAAAIRVCEYAADHLLIAAGVVRAPKPVADLLAETNRLTAGTPPSDCADGVESRFFLTFSNGLTDIEVGDAGECGNVTNGKTIALGAPAWRLDLARSDLTIAKDHRLPIPTGAGPHESTRQFLTGTLAADGVCFWVEAADHTRTDVLWPEGYTARADPRRVIDFGFHVVGVVGQDVAIGGRRAQPSATDLAAVPPGIRGCISPEHTIWVAV